MGWVDLQMKKQYFPSNTTATDRRDKLVNVVPLKSFLRELISVKQGAVLVVWELWRKPALYMFRWNDWDRFSSLNFKPPILNSLVPSIAPYKWYILL